MREWYDIDWEAEENAYGEGFEVQQTPVSFEQMELIEQLLKRSNLDHDQREQIEQEAKDYNQTEATVQIEYLQENQLGPIQGGFNYGMGDIKDKLNKEI